MIEEIRDFEKPESLTIKSSGGKYSIPLGDATAYMTEHMNALKLQEIVSKNSKDEEKPQSAFSKIEVYDYQNRSEDSDVQRYIFNYPVTEIPLDISSYFKKMDGLSLSQGDNSLTQKVEVPELGEMNFAHQEKLDFNKIIIDNFTTGFAVGTIPEINLTLGSNKVPSINFSITSPDFDSISFEDGYLEFLFEADNCTPSFDFEIFARADIYDNTTKISGTEDVVTVIKGAVPAEKLRIPLKDCTLKPNLTIVFEFGTTGAAPGYTQTNSYKVTGKLSSDTRAREITGLTLPEKVISAYYLDYDQKVDTAGARETLQSAVIDEGKISCYLSIPKGWSGIYADGTTFSSEGGIVINNDEFKNVKASSEYIVYKEANLAGKNMFSNPEGVDDINMKVHIPFQIFDAHLVLHYDESGQASDVISFDANTDIKRLKNAKVKMARLQESNLTKKISQSIPENTLKFIKQMNVISIGLKGFIETDLPSNDMQLTTDIDSNEGIFNGLHLEKAVDFRGPAPYEINVTKYFEDDLLETMTDGTRVYGKKIVLGPDDASLIDFDVNLGIEGSDKENPEIVTFSTIEMGHSYELKFNVDFDYDWYSIVLNTESTNLEGDIDLGFNIRSFLSDIKDSEDDETGGESSKKSVISDILKKIKFQDDAIKGQIYVTRPDISGLESFTGFTGSLKLDYTGKDESGEEVTKTDQLLFDTGNGDDPLSFVKIKKSFAELANDKNVITACLTGPDSTNNIPPSGVLNGTVMVDMVNCQPESEVFKYNFEMAGSDESQELTIRKTDIDSLKEESSSSIKISIAFFLSLKFKVTDDIVIDDVFSTFGKGLKKDLLGREGLEEDSDFEEYKDLVEKIQLVYSMENNSGIKMVAKMTATADGETEPYMHKTLTVRDVRDTKDFDTISLGRDDVDNMFTSYPFTPIISMTIKKNNSVVVPINPYFRAKAIITAETKGEYKIWGGDD